MPKHANTIMRVLLNGLDTQAQPLLAARDIVQRPTRGWLRAIRQALGFSTQDVAKRMGIKRQPYSEIETREMKETVSLAVLSKAADAMDCELVYFIVPKKGIAPSFSKLAEHFDPWQSNLKAVDQTMKLEGQDDYTTSH